LYQQTRRVGMNTRTINSSGLLRTIIITGLIYMTVSFTSVANAANGCGFGWHRTFFHGCITNYHGAFARPAPEHPGCWRNYWGALRC
jgi:hypothetical protein